MKSSGTFPSGVLFFSHLAPASFGPLAEKKQEKLFLKKKVHEKQMLSCTPVFPAKRKNPMRILEFDYPEVAMKFAALFPDAEKQIWVKEGETLFVSFSRDGYKANAVFSLPGQMNYYIANRDTADLTWYILQRIKRDYNPCTILNCRKTEVSGDAIYEAVLENNPANVRVRVYDNEIKKI